MRHQIVRPASVPTNPGYSQAVRAGQTLYVSGQVSLDSQGKLVGPADIAAQAAQVFANVKAVVEAGGGTLEDVVKLTTYTTSIDHRPAIAEARSRYWQSDWPSSTFVVISSLASSEYLVEVEAIAVLP